MKVKETADELLGDLVTAFEGFRRKWVYESIKEDTTAFLEKLGPQGAATQAEKRAWAALMGSDARDVVDAVISGRSLDALLSASAGDLQSANGWLAPAQQSRLARIDAVDTLRWRLMKVARNVLEHESAEAVDLLRRTMTNFDNGVDPFLFVRRAPDGPANVRRWLVADVGPPDGYEPNRLARTRLGHLHAVLSRSAKAMRSTATDNGSARDGD